ncbi:transcriptional regulator, GntR family [Alteribacillus persepolensis]|uniref:Transcriptional regulator, GntR family n=1 Tax=Alteribacillus persepolensis TaxID=568899 RepID=A0A1G8J4B5_9BACI|nr:GntR family transcriptional regulator [Alteribacillus persepolensis]SDI25817.1 transcriptional regulator, GntR family [Alteribacillus persepolensis]
MISKKNDFLGDFEIYSVTEQIADYIKQAIVYGDLTEGEKLPSETVMAERLNVSRNTVRGALNLLSSEYLIETRSGRSGGHYVAIVTEDAIKQNFGDSLNLSVTLGGVTLEEVIEMRRIIEVEAAYLAALRRNEEDLRRLAEIIEFLNDEPLTDLLFCRNNYNFNNYISLATKNKLINLDFIAISRAIVPLFKYINVPMHLRNTLNNELEGIYIAIYNKDSRDAAERMSNHLHHFEEFFKSLQPFMHVK